MKNIFLRITADIFGNSFAFRDKMGFGIPIKEFLINKKCNDYMNDNVLPHIKHRGLFNYKLASSWLSNINTLKYYELEALWVIVSFEIWATIYLDNNENSNSSY